MIRIFCGVAAVFGLSVIVTLPSRAADLSNTVLSTTVSVLPSGQYEVRHGDWTFRGHLNSEAWNIRQTGGTDSIGSFHETAFAWSNGVAIEGAVRLYDNGVLRWMATPDAPVTAEKLEFPAFTVSPSNLHTFCHSGMLAKPLFSASEEGTPWMLFDDQGQAAIISPLNYFCSACMRGNGRTRIACGWMRNTTLLPAGLCHETLMAFGAGIKETWSTWGKALADRHGRKPPANDADIGLNYLGYWTDNGAAYYYNFDKAKGCQDTLIDVIANLRTRQVPVRYLQLDSWWYSKSFTDIDGKQKGTRNWFLPSESWNRWGGLLDYTAAPTLFPQGLGGLHAQVGLPLFTHNRWVDPESPYRNRFRISGFAALDRGYWREIIDYLAKNGVVRYEQDWLSKIHEYSPKLQAVPGIAEEFADNMAQACAEKGLTIEYATPSPCFFLEGARHSNVTTIVVNADRFDRSRWEDDLYVSQLAAALGLWPWVDVLMSTETPNLLLATLSAGMVGIGDEIGKADRASLLRSVRPDGVIVKPDHPLVPLDTCYLSDAKGLHYPLVGRTYTDHKSLRTHYVFAFNRTNDCSVMILRPSALGLNEDVVAYDMRASTGHLLHTNETLHVRFDEGGWAYYVIAPFGKSGIALCGDAGKFVSMGRKRIPVATDEPHCRQVVVSFAKGERSITLFGFAKSAPKIRAVRGSAGTLNYAPATGRFEVTVGPSPEILNEPPFGDAIQQAQVELTLDP